MFKKFYRNKAVSLFFNMTLFFLQFPLRSQIFICFCGSWFCCYHLLILHYTPHARHIPYDMGILISFHLYLYTFSSAKQPGDYSPDNNRSLRSIEVCAFFLFYFLFLCLKSLICLIIFSTLTILFLVWIRFLLQFNRTRP